MWQVPVYVPEQIFNFPSNLITPFDETAKNSFQVPKPARNSGKIANKLNDRPFWRSKQDLIYQVKAARSAHSMADVIPFLAHLI